MSLRRRLASLRRGGHAGALQTCPRTLGRHRGAADQPVPVGRWGAVAAPVGQITAPTLVLHGTEDPLLPVEHGYALAAEIPGALFLAMPRTGHEVFPRNQWDTVVPAILDHTARH
ncbi:alpha/beta fold hydrolase [Streptomyces sp. MZ04]|nr:alpha/beta fold hydrolase [Streptomyces sp. MZ04]TGA95276.1 alpha/beta fold hydrolase [Streptomyces sp. MZ04]